MKKFFSKSSYSSRFFFFQAEDGIRDVAVTGVQTCALPILQVDEAIGHVADVPEPAAVLLDHVVLEPVAVHEGLPAVVAGDLHLLVPRQADEIGRASCRERV